MRSLNDYQAAQPLAARYFLGAFRSRSLAHGYVLKGQPLATMYQFALDLAALLNCSNPQDEGLMPCGTCRDCRWIADNAHPAVMTLSRLTYQVDEDGNALKTGKSAVSTAIRTGQVGYLLQKLSLSSPHYRVIVFTDAEEAPGLGAEAGVLPPYEWRADARNDGKRFLLRPLTQKVFNAASANRFLKTLEEPLPRTLFIFLTDHEESLLETIVSRCQVIPFKAEIQTNPEEEALRQRHQPLLDRLFSLLTPDERPRDSYAMVDYFKKTLLDEAGLTPEQAILLLERDVQARLRAEMSLEPSLYRCLCDHLHHLEATRRLLQAKTQVDASLLSLFDQWGKPGLRRHP